MICYSCRNLNRCSVFRKLHDVSNDFSINQCQDYNDETNYRKIAKHDDLMKLIYDYFTGQLVGVSEKEARKAIEYNMLNL